VGWVIGVLVTIPVIIVWTVTTGKAVVGGGVQTPWYVIPICMLVLCGTANAINRARRHRPSSGVAVSPPLLESDEIANQKANAVDAAAKGGYVAGRMQDGRFVLSSGEVSAILKNPDAFDNVLVGQEPQELMSASPRAKWFLVLARGAGIAIRQDGSQIWSVLPEGVTTSHISSVDGRTQNVEFDATCIAAWRCDTWQGLCVAINPKGSPGPDQLPARWALLVWSLSTRKDPSAWLRFRLPYGNIKEGLSQLCASSGDLAVVIDRCGPKKVAKLVGEVAPEYMPAMEQALSAGAQQKAKYYLRTGFVLTIAGVILTVFMTAVGMSTFDVSFGSIGHATWDTIGSLLGLASLGLLLVFVGIGAIIYSGHMRKWKAHWRR
jgi:hypothetical protein